MAISKRGLRVLVSNATNDGGLAAIRCLSKAGLNVVSVDNKSSPLSIRSRYVCAHYTLTDSSQHSYEQALEKLVRELRPDIFLPLDTPSVLAACRNQASMSECTAMNVPTLEAFLTAYHKPTCTAVCRELGIPCPRDFTVAEGEELLQQASGQRTLVVKPAIDAGAGTGVRYVSEAGLLRSTADECTQHYGGAHIQEYIPGGVERMSTVVLWYSSRSDLTCVFTTQKSLQWPLTGGVTAGSYSTDAGYLIDQVRPFFEKLRWQGIAEVELKFDERDRMHKVIEINPSYPAYLRFAIHCGINLPELVVGLATEDERAVGEPWPAYTVGLNYVNPGLYLRAFAAELRQPGSRLNSIRRTIRDFTVSIPLLGGMLSDPLAHIARVLRELHDDKQ